MRLTCQRRETPISITRFATGVLDVQTLSDAKTVQARVIETEAV
jgi:hypothetical protein